MIGKNGENLVFILSTPRAGSTMLAAILGNHSKSYCPAELWLMLPLWAIRTDAAAIVSPYDHALAMKAWEQGISPDEYNEAAASFARKIYNSKLAEMGKDIFVDKTPRYYHILPWIDTLFPKARKIWLQRNPLDAFLSYKEAWDFQIDELVGEVLSPHSFDITISQLFFLDYFKQRSKYKFIVKYENLVRDQNDNIKSICDFLDITFEVEMLDYGKNTELIQSYSSKLMGDKKMLGHANPHTLSINRWQKELSQEEVEKIVTTLGGELFKRLGYYEDYKQALKFIGLKEVEVNQRGKLDTLIAKHQIYADKELSYPGSANFTQMGRDNAAMSAQLEQIKALLVLLRRGKLLTFFRKLRAYSKSLF